MLQVKVHCLQSAEYANEVSRQYAKDLAGQLHLHVGQWLCVLQHMLCSLAYAVSSESICLIASTI